MATATLHLDDVPGHVTPAKCWKLDPPVTIGGQEHEYVCIWIKPSTKHQAAEVVTVAATESGAVAPARPGEPATVQRRAGSYALHGDPDSADYEAGAHWLALQLLGGYDIRVQDAAEDPDEADEGAA
ncbi:hypothetical protein [Nocardia asteroides]|uniref:hypothetical protein n=1 Tax=Nocardia asteroides TaxID=1824 RepID=UPI0033C0DC35